MDVAKAIGHKALPVIKHYTEKDGILFALSCNANSIDQNHLLYEGNPNFQISPLFLVALGMESFPLNGHPGIECPLDNLLHVEQFIEVFGEIPKNGSIKNVVNVVDVIDKGKNAVVVRNIESFDNTTGRKLAFMQYSIFQRKFGGFGGPKSSKHLIVTEKNEKTDKPDNVVTVETSVNQAAIFRLCNGDKFPLHICPQTAKNKGFKAPILHGICALGISVQAIINLYYKGNWSNVKAVKCHFTAPVYPGQTLKVDIWKKGQKIWFESKCTETDHIAISNGFIEFKENSRL